ncbi:MAG: PAS domain S-box protein [Gammaproteobacteria bacterium]
MGQGQPFDRFLSKSFRSLLARHLEGLRAGREHEGQLWAPEGLTAVRADGEEFPIEGTISPMQASGKRFYTVILRDIKERHRAEQSLRLLLQENRYLQQQLSEDQRFENIVGHSGAMRRCSPTCKKWLAGTPPYCCSARPAPARNCSRAPSTA